MAENFADLKIKITDIFNKMQDPDPLVASFNHAGYIHDLHELKKTCKKNFPKEPNLGDEYTMYFLYAIMDKESRSEEDNKDWFKYTKKFINHCPVHPDLTSRICSVIHHLPEMGASSHEIFIYGKKALELLPRESEQYNACRNIVETMGINDYNNLLGKARTETDYQKKCSTYEKVLNNLINLPIKSRYPSFYSCIHEMEPIFKQTVEGAKKFPCLFKKFSTRVFHSLPYDVQAAIRRRKQEKDWYYK